MPGFQQSSAASASVVTGPAAVSPSSVSTETLSSDLGLSLTQGALKVPKSILTAKTLRTKAVSQEPGVWAWTHGS